ncbi:MAG: hypothetical protein HDQ97_05425 [Lachnospiraceae bacterium]|nr:hypothetical protein [Lachnospiraceae bacterium]
MFEELKKRSMKKRLFPAIVMLVIGAALLVFLFPNVVEILKGRVAFETLRPYEIKENMLVDVSLDMNFGCYMEEYEKNTQTHYTRTTDLYYIIWTGDQDATDYCYMGIKVPVSDEDKMEEMAEASFNNMRSNPVIYSGEIQEMPAEHYQYFKEYFLDSGFTEEEFRGITLPYFINVKAMQTDTIVVTCVFAVCALVFIVLGIVMIVNAARGGRLNVFRKELEDAGFGEAEANLEYQGARIMHKGDDFRIGKRLTFFIIGSKPHVLVNDEIVWAYQKTTTHRTNGIKTGTTYSVVLNAINKKKYETQHTFEKKQFDISAAGKDGALEILEYIHQIMPWVLLGYDNDLSRLYNKDCQSFLDIQYTKVEHNQLT